MPHYRISFFDYGGNSVITKNAEILGEYKPWEIAATVFRRIFEPSHNLVAYYAKVSLVGLEMPPTILVRIPIPAINGLGQERPTNWFEVEDEVQARKVCKVLNYSFTAREKAQIILFDLNQTKLFGKSLIPISEVVKAVKFFESFLRSEGIGLDILSLWYQTLVPQRNVETP